MNLKLAVLSVLALGAMLSQHHTLFAEENPLPPLPHEIMAEQEEAVNEGWEGPSPEPPPAIAERAREFAERYREGEEQRENNDDERQIEIQKAEEIREGNYTAEEERENDENSAENEKGNEEEAREFVIERLDEMGTGFPIGEIIKWVIKLWPK